MTDSGLYSGFLSNGGRFALRRLRRTRGVWQWFLADFLRNPGLEAYSWYESLKNARFARKLRDSEAEGRDESLTDYYPRSIPKTVWLFWSQGEAHAPYVVRRCIDSWRRQNPGWDVRVLDAQSVGAHIDLSDVPQFLPPRFHADMLRLRLLNRHGGVWADATTHCHRPLDEWLPLAAASGFFAFAHPGPGRWVDNWFLAAEAGDILIDLWERQYSRYIRDRRQKPKKYFMTMYNFQWRLLTSACARTAWRRMTKISGQPTFLMMAGLKGLIPMQVVRDAVHGGLPVSKLSYKAQISDAAFDRIFSDLAPRDAGLKPKLAVN